MTEMIPPEVTDRDVYITRSFRAPREVVWKFWTEPERLAQWFGPVGVSTPSNLIDVDIANGGHWRLTMVDDTTGAHYPMSATIVKVIEFEYLEMTVSAETGVGDLEGVFLRVTFHDHGETTRMTMHQGPFTDEQRELTTNGWGESFVTLDAILAAGVE
jgi:uncharacterized protein YndB with AHSA1/START domain